MTASAEDISKWFDNGVSLGRATYMIVARDTFNNENYPVYVYKSGYTLEETLSWFREEPMAAIDEIYSFALPKESQMKEVRAWHTEAGNVRV